jgi:hypothetical protein
VATNADHQRAWRQRQKAKLAELERQVLTMRRRRPRRAKPTTNDANEWIRELGDFTSDYLSRVNVWRETHPPLSAKDRAVLMETFHFYANELSMLAQSFLPDLPESAPEPTRKRKTTR